MPDAIRALLAPVSWIYGAVVLARNFCYESGLFTITAVNTPVISVGNITAGGTGKTPLVEYLVGTLLHAGVRPAVLSRGYRRVTTGTVTVSDGASAPADPDRGGDEPAQIARKFPGCVVVVDEDRVRGARFLESGFHPDVILLDDGFQHRALHRDLDIVVIAPGAGRRGLLPAGDGREPEAALRRADIVVRNIGGDFSPAGPDGAAGSVGPDQAAGVRMRYDVRRFVLVESGREVNADELAAARLVAFCGVGNPRSFADTLGRAGLKPDAFLPFPDHHRYTGADIRAIQAAAASAGAGFVLTTEKDAVRLSGAEMPGVSFRDRLVAVVIGAVVTEGRETLEREVLRVAGRRPA